MSNLKCCGRLRDAVTDDWYPLIYDDHVQEVQLRLSDGDGIAIIHHCPFCGEKLASGRSRLFTKPTDRDSEDVRQQLEGLTLLHEVIEKLGEPNDSGTGCGSLTRPWREWACYSEIWESLELTVGEHEDGGISWVISGQPIAGDSLKS